MSPWEWLGVTTLAGAIGTYLAIQKLPPRLTITEIKNKSATLSFESRIVIKNIGKLPSYNVWANVLSLSTKLAGTTISGMSAVRCGAPVSKLDPDETIEIPAIPTIGTSPGMRVEACEYKLDLEYKIRVLGYKRVVHRYWHMELRDWGTGFAWQFSAL